MNRTKHLLIGASMMMLLTSCGGGGASSSSLSSESSREPSPLDALQAALDSFGTNYTAEFKISGDDSGYHPTLLVGEGFLANRYEYQITGYGKIENDGNTYHRYDHYRSDNIDPSEGQYFKESGRVDFTDEDLVSKAKLSNYFDVSKFTLTEDGTYLTLDEENTVGYLNLVNTAMGYYFFGHGTAGLEIALDDEGALDEIRFWGVGDDDTGVVDPDALWATIEFSDIGTTEDPIFFSVVSSAEYDLTPITEWLPRIGRDGHALYEGVEFEFSDMCIATHIGESPDKIFLNWNGNNLINFEVDDFSAFGNVYDNFTLSSSFKAKIHGDNGHVVLTNIGDVSYSEDCIDVYSYEVEGGESWYYDFGDLEYGRNNNGSKVTLLNATYEGGYKATSKGEELVLEFSYINCGEKYSIPVVLPAGASDDLRSSVGDLLAEAPVGSVYNLNDLVFFHSNGNIGCYISELSMLEEGTSFASLCEEVLGDSIPLYSGNLGFEFYWYTEIPGDDDVSYPGVFAVAELKDSTAAGFEDAYGAELVGAGYEFQNRRVDEDDGTVLYQYGKGDIAILFSQAFTDEGYAYYILEAVDLGSPIVPIVYDWNGTYNIHFDDSGENYALIISDDGATFNGDSIEYSQDENRLSFQYNDWNIALQDNGDGTYWGLCTTSETEYELTVTKVVEEEE